MWCGFFFRVICYVVGGVFFGLKLVLGFGGFVCYGMFCCVYLLFVYDDRWC